MLSQEIYESWNAKTFEDLSALLESVEGPRIPPDVKSSNFKKAVLQKIQKRRAAELRKKEFIDDDDDYGGGCCGCFGCCGKRGVQITYYECTSLPMFKKLCAAGTENFSRSVSSTKALIQKLSYWESVKSGTDGLSVIGGDLWILSFACQHLIDSPASKDQYCMQAHLADVRGCYQELAQAGEMFLERAQTFITDMYHVRSDSLDMLKKLVKKWSIPKELNPLNIRPEEMKNMPRPRRKLGSGLERRSDIDDDEDVFSVKWSPLTVTIQLPDHDMAKPFGKLHPQDRMTIFKKFIGSTMAKLEMAAEDMTTISQQLFEVEVDDHLKLSGRQIAQSLSGFAKSALLPNNLMDGEKKTLIFILNEYWYSADVLYENVYILTRLVQETRDIIRTCYVYADIFYKWHMPTYDAFIRKRKRRSSSDSAKDVLSKIAPKHKLSDKLGMETSILSLMDFSSSIYQGVVQEIPVVCEGMLLRLRTNELDGVDEPFGLVSNIVDKRKSKATIKPNKGKGNR